MYLESRALHKHKKNTSGEGGLVGTMSPETVGAGSNSKSAKAMKEEH